MAIKKKAAKKAVKKQNKKKVIAKSGMSSNALSAIKGLMIAIQTEIDGYNFYMIAAQKTKNEKGKQMFEFLAKEEVKHRKYLENKYKVLMRGGDWGSIAKPTAVPKKYQTKSPIFTSEFDKRAKLPNFEMTALSIGILLEQKSIEFFNDMANKTKDAQAKRIFRSLARWEDEHLKLLNHQHQLLGRESWEENRFEPIF
ncbi:MAG: ferritin family protein [candidate division Zixibacteria bacterium]|nr:ferritin family protein [candidate division Zixibacteria bacterium]